MSCMIRRMINDGTCASRLGSRARPATARDLAGIGVILLLTLALPNGSYLGFAAGYDTAPLFTTQNLEGNVVSLSEFRGDVVLLLFFATWCVPCVEWFPAVQSLAMAFADQGAILLVLGLDRSVVWLNEFVGSSGHPSSSVLWESYGESCSIGDLYGVVGIPQVVLINRQGRVRFADHPAHLEADVIEECLALPIAGSTSESDQQSPIRSGSHDGLQLLFE